MTYAMSSDLPVLSVSTGSWTADGIVPQFIYKNAFNTFILVFKGIDLTGDMQFGVATSPDLITWTISNDDNPVISPGIEPFIYDGFITAGSQIQFSGSPISLGTDSYLQFFCCDNKLGYVIFSNPFNITFVSDPLYIPSVTGSEIEFATQVEVGGYNYLFVLTENNDISRFYINLSSRTLTYIDSFNFLNFNDSWCSGGILGINALSYNNEVQLFVTGKGSGFLQDIYTVGLVRVGTSWSIEEFSPMIVAPINGGIDWGYSGAQGDISGDVVPIVYDGTLYMILGMADFSDVFSTWCLGVPLNISEPT